MKSVFEIFKEIYLKIINEAVTVTAADFNNYMYNGFYIKFENVQHIIEKFNDKSRGGCTLEIPKMTPSQYKKNIELFLDKYFILFETKDHRYDDITSYMVKFKSFNNLCIPIIVYYKDDPDLFKGEYKFLVKPGALKPKDYFNKNYDNVYLNMESKMQKFKEYIEVEL